MKAPAAAHQAPELGFRRRHIGRALARAFWLFEDHVLTAMHAEGYADFRQADATVIRLLPEGGGRITELAQRADMTKQGMGKLVASLEARGYLQRAPDPDDGRAQRVLYTSRGLSLLHTAGGVIARLEAEWADQVGAEKLEEVRSVLLTLADALGPPDYL